MRMDHEERDHRRLSVGEYDEAAWEVLNLRRNEIGWGCRCLQDGSKLPVRKGGVRRLQGRASDAG